MSFNKAILISLVLFLLGVCVQTLEVNSIQYANEPISPLAFVYAPLYVCGIGFIPLYSMFKYIKQKFKK